MHSVDAHEEKKTRQKIKKRCTRVRCIPCATAVYRYASGTSKNAKSFEIAVVSEANYPYSLMKKRHIYKYLSTVHRKSERLHRPKCIMQSKWSPMTRQHLWYSIKYCIFYLIVIFFCSFLSVCILLPLLIQRCNNIIGDWSSGINGCSYLYFNFNFAVSLNFQLHFCFCEKKIQTLILFFFSKKREKVSKSHIWSESITGRVTFYGKLLKTKSDKKMREMNILNNESDTNPNPKEKTTTRTNSFCRSKYKKGSDWNTMRRKNEIFSLFWK